MAATWNVAEQRPKLQSLKSWLGSVATRADVCCFGLQEIEKLGGSSVATSAAKEALGRGDVLNANGVWWQNNMLQALEETSPGWDVGGCRQLSGMLLLVFVRKKFASQLGACVSAATPCGIMGVGGNKGAVGIRVSLFRRIISCVNCHLAAHQGAVAKRNRNFETVMDNMSFFPASANDYWRRPAKQAAAVIAPVPSQSTVSGGDEDDDDGGDGSAAAPAAGSGSAHGSAHGSSRHGASADDELATAPLRERKVPLPMGLADSDLLVWVGDTNYRIDATYDEAVAAISRGADGLRELRRLDQCRRERVAGRTFKGLREGVLRFPPTYKFDKGATSRLAYDSSEKHRIPAWCDRVLWADASGGADPGADSDREEDGGVAGTLHVVAAALDRYESVPEVCDSDHKPVRALLRVTLPVVDARKQRRAFCTAVESVYTQQAPPDAVLWPAQPLPPTPGGVQEGAVAAAATPSQHGRQGSGDLISLF